MDYQSLVHRVRELVWEHVPAGSTVAVVSKGDPALILFDQRNGWHYPQTGSGQYLGHHPETGMAAIAHLESLRLRGARYFVIPSIYAWFLDFYRDLRHHLERNGELVHQDGHCSIYALTKRELTGANLTAAERQLRELVGAVLPPGSAIAALSWSRTALAGLSDFRFVEPITEDGVDEAGFAGLAVQIRDSGAEYVVIPATAPRRTGFSEGFVATCRATWPTVLHHRHVCAVFAIPATQEQTRRGAHR